MIILGIETSCDDTGVALYHTERGLLVHCLSSQHAVHAAHGGVVPELASRAHLDNILPLIQACLDKAELKKNEIDSIAYTAGPGLIGALLVGACVASGLQMSLNCSLIPVNHLEAHLLAIGLETRQPRWPFAVLLISGGHTLIALAKSLHHYHIKGETLDDAVGEAFDKTAKLIGLPYPGGPALAELAKAGDPNYFKLTKPMINRPGLDFSLSGLKTQVMGLWYESKKTAADRANLAAAFQQTVAEMIQIKLERARQQDSWTRLVVAGGVGANWKIRDVLKAWAGRVGVDLFFPRIEFCTDNAAMVAYAAAEKIKAGEADSEPALFVRARWPIDALA